MLKKILALLYCCLFYYTCIAQNGAMDLKECVQYVIDHSYAVQKASLEAQKSEYQVEQMKSRALPSIQLNADVAYNFAQPVYLAPGNLFESPERDIPIRFGKHIHAGLNIEARQALFTPVTTIGAEGREKLIEVNQLQVQRSREQAVLEVANTYYQAMVVKKKRGLIEANLNRIEGLLQLTRRQYQNGFAKEIDVKRLSVAQQNLETQLQNLNLRYEQLLYLLKHRMSMPLEEQIQLPDSLDSRTYDIPETLTQTLDPEQRTEINLLQLRGDLQQLQVDRLEAARLPSIYLQGALRFNAWGDNPAEWLRTDYWFGNSYLGLRLEYTIFDGYQQRAKIQESLLDAELAELELQSTRQSLRLQHFSAQQQLRVNYNQLRSLEENLATAREVYEITEKQYAQGISPIMELLSAETGLREAETNFLTALLEVRQAEIELWHAKGILIERLIDN